MNAARRIAAGVLLAAIHGTAGTAEPSTASALRICLPENDPPRSSRSRATGLDIDVARLLARGMQRPLQLVWLPELGAIDEVSDFNFTPLVGNRCDAHLSVPGPEAVSAYRGALALSEPYYGAAYELIPETAHWQWGQPFEGTIAVLANTVAHVAIDAVGLGWTMRADTSEIGHAVASGNAAMGLVWGPDVVTAGVDRSPAFEPPPVLRWNLHAATRNNDPLLAEINRVFAEASFAGRMSDILAVHGVPARSPFASVYTPHALRALKPR